MWEHEDEEEGLRASEKKENDGKQDEISQNRVIGLWDEQRENRKECLGKRLVKSAVFGRSEWNCRRVDTFCDNKKDAL